MERSNRDQRAKQRVGRRNEREHEVEREHQHHNTIELEGEIEDT